MAIQTEFIWKKNYYKISVIIRMESSYYNSEEIHLNPTDFCNMHAFFGIAVTNVAVCV